MKYFKTLLLLGICFCLTSCEHVEKEAYFSFTLTCEDQNGIHSEVYHFGLIDEGISKITDIPYTSQYPLTVYDKQNNFVYYSAKDETGKADQMFYYDVETKKSRKLTKDFFAINYIIPYDAKIFIAGVVKGSEYIAVRPFLYDIETETLQDLTWDEDLHLSVINFDPLNREFILSGYSASDDSKRIQNQDHIAYKPGLNTVIKFKDDDHSILYETDGVEIQSAVSNQGKYYISEDHNTIYKIEGSKKSKELLSGDAMIYFESVVHITEDERYIYYFNGSGLYKYDTEKRVNYELFKDERDNCTINNAQFLIA